MAPLVDKKFFLRAAPERRAPVHGCVDKNLLGCDFYVNVPTYELFIKSRGVVSLEVLRRVTGSTFSDNVYFNLVTAANFARTKYSGKQNSNATSVPKKFRLRLCNGNIGDGIEKMQVVGTSSD